MSSNPKLSLAIAAILSGSGSGWVHAAAPAAADTDVDAIQEITVTAQRRTENIQNVPITIQAMTAETLAQLHVETFDDYVKYLPNVSFQSNGPGQSNIYMRGLSAGGVGGTQGSGAFGAFPNVAIYLDDQSGQLPGRNLDIYAADLERIEVLEGPQGTLFGAGAEAGVVRYITNKPKLNTTEGSVTASYGTTAHGADNSSATAVINLPLVADTLAVRAVIYDDSRGGYIDNVAGTFTRKDTDLSIRYAGGSVPPNSPVANNNALVQNNFNPVTYQGIRVSMLYQINDDWNALLTQSYQTMNSQGVFYQMPNSSDGVPLQPLQVTNFSPSYDKDQFENTSWTVNGKIGPLKAVYTGGYLVRNIDQRSDYTNYSRGVYADYYQCMGAAYTGTGTAKCYSPVASWREQVRNTHESHEFRLSTPDDERVRGIFGAFWERQQVQDQLDYLYKTVPACTADLNVGCETDIGPVPGSTTINPNVRNDNTSFFEDITRGYRQYAFFGSMDFDIIPKVLTVTAGTRYYDFKNFQEGTLVSGFGCLEAGPAPCSSALHSANSVSDDQEHEVDNYSGFKSRANISWHITPDTLVYYTYSQGFRPGGYNRQGGPTTGPLATTATPGSCHIPDANGNDQYCLPLKYDPDKLTNNEVGWKTQFFDHRLQVNGAIYQEVWDNAQVAIFEPGYTGNLQFGTNGQNFRTRGMELSIEARVTQGLTVTSAASYNHTQQTNSPSLIANNPALLGTASAAEYGQPITETNGNPLPNVFGPIGGPAANSPLVQASLRARYDWNFNEYKLFAQAGGTYQTSSLTQTSNNATLAATGGAINSTLLQFKNPAYALFDASVGIAKDAWTVQLFGQNLADRNVSLFTSTGEFAVAQTPTRPRVLGVQAGYKF